MSVAVAVEATGGVVAGCDSFLGDESGAACVLDRPKWWRASRDLVVLWTGDLAAAQAAERARPWPRQRAGEGDEPYLVRVAATIRAAQGAPKEADPYLFVLRGAVWTLAGGWSVHRAAEGYAAVGAGADVAVGALHATRRRAAAARVLAALQAAAAHCEAVRPPFYRARVVDGGTRAAR